VPKLLIFDWDGTLCDSLSRIVYCLRCAAESAGLPPPSDPDARHIVGLGMVDALTTLFPGIAREQIDLMRDSYSRHFVEADREPSPFFSGVSETLWRLKHQGYLLAVATGKSRRGLDRVLQARQLDQFFDGTRCADETAGKPHPLMLIELMKEFACSPEESIMIGDTEYDLAMAANAGMSSIGVSYGAHDSRRLSQYRPLACLDKFSDVEVIIKNIKNSKL